MYILESKGSRLECGCPRVGDGCLSSGREGGIRPSFAFLFCLGERILPALGRADPPYSVTELNGSILQCTLRDALRNNVSPTLWASLSPVQLTHKINHHTIFRGQIKESEQRGKATVREMAGLQESPCRWTFRKDTFTVGLLVGKHVIERHEWLEMRKRQFHFCFYS